MNVELGYFYHQDTEKRDKLNNLFRNFGVSTDIDQVEIDNADATKNRINEDFNASYTIDDITGHGKLEELLRKNHPEFKDPEGYANRVWNLPEVMADCLPVAGSLGLSRYLFESGVTVFRVTSRPANLREITLDWYRRFMPWVDPSLVNIQEEGNSVNMDFKVDRLRQLGVGFHFEDSLEHAEEIVKRTKATVILVPQPWNMNYMPNIGSRIIISPRYRYQTLPKLIQVYANLVDRFT